MTGALDSKAPELTIRSSLNASTGSRLTRCAIASRSGRSLATRSSSIRLPWSGRKRQLGPCSVSSIGQPTLAIAPRSYASSRSTTRRTPVVTNGMRDHQDRRFALALEQGVGRDRRAHLDRSNALDRDRRGRVAAEQMPNAGNGSVAVQIGVVRQQLVRDERTIGTKGDDVGERAAAIDPELPLSRLRPFSHSVLRSDAGACMLRDAREIVVRMLTYDAEPCRCTFAEGRHGSSGWVMATGSARIVADIVAGREPGIHIDGLTLDRYRTGRGA